MVFTTELDWATGVKNFKQMFDFGTQADWDKTFHSRMDIPAEDAAKAAEKARYAALSPEARKAENQKWTNEHQPMAGF